MNIRLAQLDDAHALARVIVDTGRTAHKGQVPDEVLLKTPLDEAYAESERNWTRTLRRIAEEANPRECIYVVEDEGGMVVGFAMGGPSRQDMPEHTGEVYALYVCPEHQRHGFGQRLVLAVSAHLAPMGMTTLEIGCLAVNTPARSFYERLGGRVIRESEFDQDGIMLPTVIYGWVDIEMLLTASQIPREANQQGLGSD